MFDRYSKVVLTVIAAALVGLFVQNAVRPGVAADPQIVKALICDPYDLSQCARVAERGFGRGNTNFLLATDLNR